MPIAPRTILLVEDNPDDEELTLRALARNNIGNQVVVVRDGQDAVDWLEATGPYGSRDPDDVPALILLDLKLPKIDGLEVLRRLRARPAHGDCAGRDPDIIEGRPGSGERLLWRREFVRAEAGRLQLIRRRGASAGDVLAHAERAAAEYRRLVVDERPGGLSGFLELVDQCLHGLRVGGIGVGVRLHVVGFRHLVFTPAAVEAHALRAHVV